MLKAKNVATRQRIVTNKAKKTIKRRNIFVGNFVLPARMSDL